MQVGDTEAYSYRHFSSSNVLNLSQWMISGVTDVLVLWFQTCSQVYVVFLPPIKGHFWYFVRNLRASLVARVAFCLCMLNKNP